MQKLLNRDVDRFLIYIALLFLFIYEINFYGRQRYLLYGYSITILISGVLLLKNQSIDKELFFYSLLFFLTSIFYLLFNHYLNSYLKYIIYLLPVFVISNNYGVNEFSSTFIKVVNLIIPIFLLLYLVNIGIDQNYGQLRLQGLLSEPSAMALPLSVAVLYHLFCNKNVWTKILAIIVLLITIYYTFSPIVYLTIIFSISVYLYNQFNSINKLIIIILIILIFLNVIDIIDFFLQYTDSTLLSRLRDGIVNIYTLGKMGYNPRFAGITEFFNDISYRLDTILFGRGLNSATPYYAEKGSLRVTFNIFTEVLFSFGLIGFTVFLYLLFRTNNFIKRHSNISNVVFSSILGYATINSAQGIVYQSILWIFIFYYLKTKRIKEKWKLAV